jgi:hypothetical protein
MFMRFALIAATVFTAACSSSSSTPPATPASSFSRGTVSSAATPMLSDRAEIRVRLDGDIGTDSMDRAFSARLASPLLGRDGRVIAPTGSLVYGRVVSTSADARRIELAFERLETRDGVYRLDASIVSAAPYAVTIAPAQGARTAMLQASQPGAIGGGPAAEDADDAPRVADVIVPFDAELRLAISGPLVRMEH